MFSKALPTYGRQQKGTRTSSKRTQASNPSIEEALETRTPVPEQFQTKEAELNRIIETLREVKWQETDIQSLASEICKNEQSLSLIPKIIRLTTKMPAMCIPCEQLVDYAVNIHFSNDGDCAVLIDLYVKSGQSNFENWIRIAGLIQHIPNAPQAVLEFLSITNWDIDSLAQLATLLLSNKMSSRLLKELALIAVKRLRNQPQMLIDFANLTNLRWQSTMLTALVGLFEADTQAIIAADWLAMAKLDRLTDEAELVSELIKIRIQPPVFNQFAINARLSKAYSKRFLSILKLCSHNEFHILLNTLWDVDLLGSVFRFLLGSPEKEGTLAALLTFCVTHSTPQLRVVNMFKDFSTQLADLEEVLTYAPIFAMHAAPIPIFGHINIPIGVPSNFFCPGHILAHIAKRHTFEFIDFEFAMRRDDNEYSNGKIISFFPPGTPIAPIVINLMNDPEVIDAARDAIDDDKQSFEYNNHFLVIDQDSRNPNTAILLTCFPSPGIPIHGNALVAIKHLLED